MVPEDPGPSRLSPDFARFAMDRAGVAIFGVDVQGRLVYANEEGLRSLGYSREELLGRPVGDVNPLFSPDRWREHWEELRLRRSRTFESLHRTRQGDVFPVELAAFFVDDGERSLACAVVRDISERKAHESVLRRYALRLEKGRQLALRALELRSPQDLAREALRSARALVPYDRGEVLLLDASQQQVTLLCAELSPSGEPSRPSDDALLPQAVSPLGGPLWEGRTWSVDDVALLPPEEECSALRSSGYRCFLGVPLRVEGDLVGALHFVARTPGAFSREHMAAAEDLAPTLALALQHARLREAREEAHRALRFTQFAVDHAATGMAWLGREGQVLYGNKKFCQALAYSLEELRRLTVFDIDLEFSRLQWDELWSQGFPKRSIAARRRYRRKDGVLLPVEVRGSVLVYQGEEHVFLVIQDVSERMQAEEKLAASERTARALLDATSDAVMLLDADDMVQAINGVMAHRFALTEEEILRSPVGEVLPPGMRGPCQRLLEEVRRAAQPLAFEEEWQGAIFEHSAFPVLDREGHVTQVAIFSRDISRRKAVERALRESEARYRLLFERSFDAMLLLDGEQCLDCNDTTLRMLRISRKEDVLEKTTRHFSPLFQADGRSSEEKAQEYVREVWERGTARFEWTFLRADGTPLVVDVQLSLLASGERPLIFSVWRDISDQKEAAEKLRRYALRVDRLHAVDKAMLAHDTPESVARDVLRHLRKLIPCHRSSIVQFDPASSVGKVLATDVDRSAALGGSDQYFPLSAFSVVEAVARGEEALVVEDLEAFPQRREFEERLFQEGLRSCVSWPIYAGQELAGTLNFAASLSHVFTDEHAAIASEVATSFSLVMQQTRLRQDRERLLDELMQKNKELESVIYITSHDLRSPLVNIQGFSSRIEKGCEEIFRLLRREDVPEDLRAVLTPLLEEKIPGALRFIRTSGEKMDKLIGGLLRLSRTGRALLSPENLCMDRVLKAVVDSQTWQIQKLGATVQIDPLPGCRGDETLINQLFSNLVDNALKYRDAERPLKIHLSGIRSPQTEEVIYEVSDTGIGMAPEDQERIWEIFARIDPEGAVPGEGLGLTLAKRIVERHGGRMWVTSMRGKGSSFFVALPPASEKTGDGKSGATRGARP